jgi:hypothetical protein
MGEVVDHEQLLCFLFCRFVKDQIQNAFVCSPARIFKYGGGFSTPCHRIDHQIFLRSDNALLFLRQFHDADCFVV